ncbi:histidine kinase dimerization/phosphoacceptor domain -containing protein [uncultured Enterovirga sp.]|uniref:sensor histidine kinase n=1 Tax=uncultured Enterovirga sp. TaxID=2026352 RepID=UPI0035CACE56
MNEYQADISDTPARDRAESHIEGFRLQGGIFVEAVRVTRMPMLVTDATLPGNPIVFANAAFVGLSGYEVEELVGQEPHFLNGEGTDPKAIARYTQSMNERRDETLEIVQYRKDGTPFRAMLFASPLDDGQGTITNHFLSYLDITRRFDAEEGLRLLTQELEERVAARTQELKEANERMAKLVAEKEMLVVEVNHRAKNSLAIAASLLSIQGRRQTDSAVRALFDEARDRLVAMSRVHDLLSKSESAQRVNLATYVYDLCEALRPITESDDRIQLHSVLEDGILIDAETAVPLGIVVTELVTNAVKYAFPAPRSGTIRAEGRRLPPDRIQVVIHDDGVGFSTMREGSLGYGLVRSLVGQIGGEMDMKTEAGLTVVISFPDPTFAQSALN